MKRYSPKDIESKWQKYWDENGTYVANLTSEKPKFFGFAMFNYPSGSSIHLGHAKNFTLPDVLVRYKRQKGYEAYSPVGFDSFGLPAENYAIKTGQSPRKTTDDAIASYHTQYRAMGWGMDWSKEIDTSKPDYYKWTQWCFLQLFHDKLAYQKDSAQWWCTKCKTVLADEQVMAGKCWRHDGEDDPLVTKKNLRQWFFKITDFADEILEATDALNWTSWVKVAQKNWIGRSEGTIVDFQLDGLGSEKSKLEVFTTACHTLFGVSFIVLAPEHPIVSMYAQYADNPQEIDEYVQHAQRKSDLDREASKIKTGVPISGLYAVNPINGEKVPVWVADYVLMGYGTGAVMGVPAHDERDFEFATKYELPIPQVVMTSGDDPHNPPQEGFKEVGRPTVVVHLRDKSTGKYALLNWHGTLSGITTAIMGGIEPGQTPEEAALAEIYEEAALKNVKITSQARWITGSKYCASHKGENRKAAAYAFLAEVDDLSKQGEIADHEQATHTLVWVDKEKVTNALTPVHQKQIWDLLWNDKALIGDGELINSGKYDGLSVTEAKERIAEDLIKQQKAVKKVNYKMRDWLISRQRYWGAPIPIIHCEACGAVPVPESQLPVELPVVEDYHPSGDGRSPLAKVSEWVNVPCPNCGKPAQRETDTMDGYVCSSWYPLRYIDPRNDKEAWEVGLANKWMPVDFYNGGDHATAHLLYARFFTRFFYKKGLINNPEPFDRMYFHAKILAPDGTFFSKSKGNGIDPLEVINSGYGADALRTYISFIAPPDVESPWSNDGLPSCYRFLNRIWNLVQEFNEGKEQRTKSEETSSGNPELSTQNLELLRSVHKAIQKVDEDIEAIKYNTAIAAMMSCVNELYKIKEADKYASQEWQFALESLVQLVAPFAPHISEELWRDLGHKDSVHSDHWPKLDTQYLVSDTITLAVQVNGKVRAEISVDTDTSEDEIKNRALAEGNVQTHLAGKEPKKIIYVKNKLVSIVV